MVEEGSFAAAGKYLGMPSTTVSRKVQGLENDLGVRLLYRSTRKLSLTEQGRSYFQLCQQHLSGIEEANNLIMQSQTQPQGKIRISAPLDFSILYVQQWINDFLAKHPKIDIELIVSDAFTDLISDRIDIAFRSGRLKDSSLIARPLGPKTSQCYASPCYLKRAGVPRHPQDLEQHDCLILGDSLLHNSWQFINHDDDLTIPVTGRYASGSMHLVIQAALAGLGIAYLPTPLAKPYADSGQLEAVITDYQSPPSDMHLIYQSQKYVTASIRLFIDEIIAKTQSNQLWS